MGVKLNRFPKFVEIDDPLVEDIGTKKTITFAILYVVTLAIIIFYYAQETYTKQVEITSPSAAKFASV